MDKKKKAAISKQEDIALTRALIWFAAAMVVEFLLLLVNKHILTQPTMSWNTALRIVNAFGIVALVLLAGAALCGFWCYKASNKNGTIAFGPMVLGTVLLTLSISAISIKQFYTSATDVLFILVPAGGVLALVYYLYQRDFFLSCLASGLALLGAWLVSRGGGRFGMILYPCFILIALVLLAAAVWVLKLKKAGGMLKHGDKRIAFLPKQANYGVMLASCVLGALVLLAVGVLGILGVLGISVGLAASMAHYLVFVLLSWLFIQLVYYTVKMM